jgi:hypothetical protein
MTADHRRETRCGRIDVKISHVVQKVETMIEHVDDLGQRQRTAPWTAIVVTAHCLCGCDTTQPLEHILRADVARMNDQIDPRQRGERLFAQEPVRVRDDPNLFVRMTID